MSIDVTFAPNLVRVVLGGVLDVDAGSQLDPWVRRIERPAPPVVLDLAAVDFADAHGLTPLLDSAVRRQAAQLPAFVLVAASDTVEKTLARLASERRFQERWCRQCLGR